MFYDEERASVIIDALELCAIANKSGSIDTRFQPVKDEKKQLDLPRNTLKKIYGELLSHCNHNVFLSMTRKYGEFCHTVNMSADTVLDDNGELRVDMIRLVRKYDFYAPPRETWVSYLKLCALALALQKDLNSMRLRIYYLMRDKESERIKHFDFSCTTDELSRYFDLLLDKVSHRAFFAHNRVSSALPSAADCVFPYGELREGQEIMIKECYSSIKRGKRLFLEAPTGTGKTVAALYPSVRAVGSGLADKVFYLTSKASTRREAFRGASKLFEGGAKLRTIVIGAKEQVCLCHAKKLLGQGGSLCNPDDCPYAKSYYDKVENALAELIESGHGYTLRQISEIARKHGVCPYELSLDLSEFCDIIICDYNYVFDPSVYFRRYFTGNAAENGKYVFLVDEAHNLVDRARDMYSAFFVSDKLEKVYESLSYDDAELRGMLEKLLLVIRSQKSLCRDTLAVGSDGIMRGFYVGNTLIESFARELDVFRKRCEAWLRSNRSHELYGAINDILYEAKKYLCVAEYFDNRFYNCVYVEGEKITMRIFCLDPSYILDKIQNRAVSTVMFSATLTPIDYFSQLLGGNKKTGKISLPSAFDPSNLFVAVAPYVSMRFNDRADNISKYVSVIAATVSRKAGNYIAYFPSYDCLMRVYSQFTDKYPDVHTVLQKKNMTVSEKESFLDFFKNDEGVLRIGFCVLGGSFSEGIDLPGARLIGAIVFGVGLPGLSNERNIIRDYYDNRGENGYDNAYAFPGMNNVLQAAGRVIRRDDDKGVVVLADDRYAEEKYRELFPLHWSNIKSANNARELAGIIQNFWQTK